MTLCFAGMEAICTQAADFAASATIVPREKSSHEGSTMILGMYTLLEQERKPCIKSEAAKIQLLMI